MPRRGCAPHRNAFLVRNFIKQNNVECEAIAEAEAQRLAAGVSLIREKVESAAESLDRGL
jgi:hypothetical protein